ncbi:Aquaporin SIP1-2-like protein [Drosera capensis]
MAKGPIQAAISDGVLTFTWMFCASAMGVVVFIIESTLGVQGNYLFSLIILTSVVAVIIFVFDAMAEALGGASFNPAGNATMYAAGMPGDTIVSMALRFPAQFGTSR